MFRAVISAYRLASISLRSLSLAVATAFLLSTTSLGGSPLASSTPSAFPRWDTSTALQRKQQQYSHNTKLGLLRLLPLFPRVSYRFIFYFVRISIVNDIITAAALSSA